MINLPLEVREHIANYVDNIGLLYSIDFETYKYIISQRLTHHLKVNYRQNQWLEQHLYQKFWNYRCFYLYDKGCGQLYKLGYLPIHLRTFFGKKLYCYEQHKWFCKNNNLLMKLYGTNITMKSCNGPNWKYYISKSFSAKYLAWDNKLIYFPYLQNKWYKSHFIPPESTQYIDHPPSVKKIKEFIEQSNIILA